MLAGKPVVINGDGEQLRDYVYVGDCAQANLLALNAPQDGVIYNLGSGRGTSVNQVFSALKTITGYDQEPAHGPAKVGETRRIYLDARKVQRDLGWEPTLSLEAGLQKTVAYFREAEPVA
jgi:UDP-glucose 4-epimerase